MKHIYRFSMFMLLIVLLVPTADAQWECLYATWDNSANGTGAQTIGVGVIKENMFVALVTNRNAKCYLIPYVNADSGLGRKSFYGYGSASNGVYKVWTDGGFDQVPAKNAFSVKAMKDSLIYLASNDDDHNVLVFKYAQDSVTVVDPFPRQETGTNSIYGIDVDSSGYVYVCNDTTTGQTADLKIYSPIKQWTPAGHTDTPVRTIDLPDGIYKGVTVSPDGKNIFIADSKNRKVLKYSGTRTTGYTLVAGFNFTLGPKDTITLDGIFPPRLTRPIGLAYNAAKNIVAVACDSLFKQATSTAYAYGRIYLLNGNTGAFISTDTSVYLIDQAKWNYVLGNGSYSARGDGDIPGNASMYTSTFDVKWDEKGFLYSQSFFGWTVEKWRYKGTLPSFTTSVEQTGEMVPTGYTVSQNYPNPFNPTTTIDFAVPTSGFVSLRVYDLLGREVATLLNEEKAAGSYLATFDATNLPSGTYLYALKAGAFSDVKKMVLVK